MNRPELAQLHNEVDEVRLLLQYLLDDRANEIHKIRPLSPLWLQAGLDELEYLNEAILHEYREAE